MSMIQKITVVENVALITFAGVKPGTDFVSDIFKAVAEKNICVDMISQTTYTGKATILSFTFDEENLGEMLTLSKEVSARYPEAKPLVSSGHAKISLFSERMRHECGVAAKVFALLSEHNIPISTITTSETDVSVLIEASALDAAAKVFEEAFG